MKKTWIFFKLRMVQLKSDKTALFFCYVLPVLLLLGIGYPLQLQKDPKIELYYQDNLGSEQSQTFLKQLSDRPLVELLKYEDAELSPYEAVSTNEIKRLLHIMPAGQVPQFSALPLSVASQSPSVGGAGSFSLHFITNDIDENVIENSAIASIIDMNLSGKVESQLDLHTLKSDRLTSYLVTLLPGLIGLTLMIIGFNGFGGVLIEEEHHGLFKNIKTIDISPIPFLAGLFLSRLLISYSVAVALCLISVFVFDIQFQVNFVLLALIVTLGSVSFLGIGLLIATISPSISAFNGIVNFVQMPFIVLGGVFFSITLFPEWLQVFSQAIPLTQVNVAMQKILFESMTLSNIGDLALEFSVLAAWCVASLLIAKYKFKW